MTSREEIREGVDGVIKCWNDTTVSSEWRPLYGGASLSQDIMLYLHSQGVVIKVDRELPENTTREVVPGDIKKSMLLRRVGDGYYDKAQQDMLKAGYVAVKPLVEQ